MLIIYHKLRGQGYQCFLAGGCVRDALLGKIANDLDLACDAAPEVVESLFSRTVNVGKAFGVIRVIIGDSDIEVTRFRQDGSYGSNQRRPDKVYFSSAKEDAVRRDFTINALFYDIEKNEVIDYVSGQIDLERKIIRTVGDSDLRFQEDALRMLRALRFSSTLNFQIEQNTMRALVKNKKAIVKISKERILQEIEKTVLGNFYLEQFKNFLESQILTEIFPHFQYNKYQLSWLQSIKSSTQGRDLEWQMIYFFQACSYSDQEILEILKTWPISQKRRQWGQFYLKMKANPKIELSFIFEKNIRLLFHPLMPSIFAEFIHLKIEIQLVKILNQILMDYQGVEPQPLVQAADLQNHFQGQKLGQALNLCFQIQILQRLTSSQEIINEFLHRHNTSPDFC